MRGDIGPPVGPVAGTGVHRRSGGDRYPRPVATSRMAEQIGRVLGGRYRLLAPIGRGASAQVYVADDVRLRRQVAVKVLHDALADDQEFLRRFRTEAQAAAALNHPHVMAVYDWGQDGDESPWIVTEYLGGGSLRALLDRGHRLTPSQALVVGLQAARGLDYAHRRGFVHRDVKPANLLFGDEGRLRIADFGLARALAEAAWTEPQGAVVGTARYASPEQAQGLALTGRADVYSLALVLVEAVTGEVPFATDTTLGTLMARVGRPLVVPDALGALAEPLAEAGEADPDQRLDGRGLAAALARVATELPRPAPVPLAGAVDVDLADDPHPTETPGSGPVTPSADDLEVPAFVRSGTVPPAEPDGRTDGDVTVVAEARAESPLDRSGGPDEARDGTLAWRPGPDDPATTVAPDPRGGGADATVVRPAGRRAASFDPGLDGDDRTVVGALRVDDDLDEDDDLGDDEDADGDPWDPRSPTGRHRRWPARALALVLALALGAVVALIVADLTRGAPVHAVPTVADQSLTSARADLEDLGWEVTVEEVRRDDTSEGDVLGTRPGAGTDLEEGQAVTLLVSQGATLVDLPAVAAGMGVEEATDLLTFSGLEPDVSRRHDEEVAADVVISVADDLPARIAKGSAVGLVVSDGPEPRTIPSDLDGRPQDEAVDALTELGLVTDVAGDFSDEVDAGLVITTDPGAGAEVARDSTVTVVVSQGPDLVTVPDVSASGSLAAAVDALEAAGLVAGDVEGPATGTPSGTTPGVGQEVRRGSEVDITLT